MAISFNHTIVASRDKRESAQFLAELFGLPDAQPFGHFMAVALDNGVNLDYDDIPEGEEIRRQHYAFLVSDQDFDSIYDKIRSRGLQHWADPRRQMPGEINHNHGGRGVYFPDPSGHTMEILTRTYSPDG
jgi:catechol 2,3-dioxygenase-like lactoylglutathione lyase family enzyme